MISQNSYICIKTWLIFKYLLREPLKEHFSNPNLQNAVGRSQSTQDTICTEDLFTTLLPYTEASLTFHGWWELAHLCSCWAIVMCEIVKGRPILWCVTVDWEWPVWTHWNSDFLWGFRGSLKSGASNWYLSSCKIADIQPGLNLRITLRQDSSGLNFHSSYILKYMDFLAVGGNIVPSLCFVSTYSSDIFKGTDLHHSAV